MVHARAFRVFRSSAMAILIAGSVFVLGPASGAMAAGQGSSATQAHWSTGSSNQRSGPALRAISLSGYPYDCTPRSDNPHDSSTYGGVVDGKGWVICRNQRPYEHVDSVLYRQDCWWIFCVWNAVGSGSMTWPPTLFTYGTVRALAIHNCNGSSSHSYYLSSYHEIHDYDGTVWYSYTSSNVVSLNCG